MIQRLFVVLALALAALFWAPSQRPNLLPTTPAIAGDADPDLERFIMSLPLPAQLPHQEPAIMSQSFFMRLLQHPDGPSFKLARPKGLKGRWVPVYTFDTRVDDETVERLTKWLKAADAAGADAVLIEIDSGGGSLDAGNKLVRAIEDAKMKVHCVVDGTAASMAFGILQACDERSAVDRAELMIHEPALVGTFHIQPSESQNISQRLTLATRNFLRLCGKRMKGGEKKVHEKVDGGREWWMHGEEALAEGAVDCVVPSRHQLAKAYEAGKTCAAAPAMAPAKKR